MHYTLKYATVSVLLLAAASGLCAFGLKVAGERFAPVAASGTAAAESAELARNTSSRPQSVLLGSAPELVARQADARREWVEVVDAVNMRQGPSSANAVVKVQLAGTTLRVASRDGQWVEVVEPETGGSGWVFAKFVKPVAPASRRAEATEKTVR